MASNKTEPVEPIDMKQAARTLMEASFSASRNSVLFTELHTMLNEIEKSEIGNAMTRCAVRLALQMVNLAASECEEEEQRFSLEAERYRA